MSSLKALCCCILIFSLPPIITCQSELSAPVVWKLPDTHDGEMNYSCHASNERFVKWMLNDQSREDWNDLNNQTLQSMRYENSSGAYSTLAIPYIRLYDNVLVKCCRSEEASSCSQIKITLSTDGSMSTTTPPATQASKLEDAQVAGLIIGILVFILVVVLVCLGVGVSLCLYKKYRHGQYKPNKGIYSR